MRMHATCSPCCSSLLVEPLQSAGPALHVQKHVGQGRIDPAASADPWPGMPREFAIPGFKPHTYCVLSTPAGIRIELRDFSWCVTAVLAAAKKRRAVCQWYPGKMFGAKWAS